MTPRENYLLALIIAERDYALAWQERLDTFAAGGMATELITARIDAPAELLQSIRRIAFTAETGQPASTPQQGTSITLPNTPHTPSAVGSMTKSFRDNTALLASPEHRQAVAALQPPDCQVCGQNQAVYAFSTIPPDLKQVLCADCAVDALTDADPATYTIKRLRPRIS